jgi:hypothetical protein
MPRDQTCPLGTYQPVRPLDMERSCSSGIRFSSSRDAPTTTKPGRPTSPMRLGRPRCPRLGAVLRLTQAAPSAPPSPRVVAAATRASTTQGCEQRLREVFAAASYLESRRKPMTTLFAVVGGWIVLNAALAAALLTRRNRPRLRAKLIAWVLKGERRPKRSTRTAQAHNGR